MTKLQRGWAMMLIATALIAAMLTAPAAAGTELLYLDQRLIDVRLGAATAPLSRPPDAPFNNRPTADSLASVIDAPAADAPEDHLQSTHVWVTGVLELVFDLRREYDLTTLHFWNYFAEGFDVDLIDFRFFNGVGIEVGALVVEPALGGSGGNPIFAENLTLAAPLAVRTVRATLSGSNGQVDFNNLGFSARRSAPFSIDTRPGLTLEVGDVVDSELALATADVDGDGFDDLIVGQQSVVRNGRTVGAVSVYSGGAAGIGATPSQRVFGETADERFGFSVAGVGDIDGDGVDDVAVGAPGSDAGAGAGYLYFGGSGGLSATAVRRLRSDEPEAELGYSVAAAGDVNGDGRQDVVLGAPGSRAAAGAMLVTYGAVRAALAASPTVIARGDQPGERFGTSVAGVGDVNGDGTDDLLAGAPEFADDGAAAVGRALAFAGAAGAVGGAIATLTGGAAGERFGSAISGVGDVDGDGFADVAIGAPGFSDGQDAEGSVSIYRGRRGGVTAAPALTLQSDRAGARLGVSLSRTGDINGDRVADLAAGAPGLDGGGAALVYLSAPQIIYPQRPAATLDAGRAALRGASIAAPIRSRADGFAQIAVAAPRPPPAGSAEVAVYNLRLNAGAAALFRDQFEN